MTNPALPSDSKTPEIAVSFEEKLRLAWMRYGTVIMVACGIVAVAILAKGGLDYLAVQRELGVQSEYAACTTPETLKAFASRHPGHPLAGTADLRVADQSYSVGKFSEAAAAYGAALTELPAGVFQVRARMGQAMAEAQSGKGSDGEVGLRQILNDESQPKPVRCEAAYHLAGLAVAAGRGGEVRTLSEQLLQIDSSSPFAERMMALRSEVPDSPAPTSLFPSLAVPAKP